MTRKEPTPVPADAVKPAPPPAPPARKEFTNAPTQGGSYDEDGHLVQRTEPEPDEHRLMKPER